MCAASDGHVEAVRLLYLHEKDASQWTALIYAAFAGDTDLVRKHLDESRHTDRYGKTALMRAAQYNYTEIVRLLIDHERGMQDHYGWTALMVTAYSGSNETALLLVQHERGLRNKDGHTALDIASLWKRQSTVDTLLQHQKYLEKLI